MPNDKERRKGKERKGAKEEMREGRKEGKKSGEKEGKERGKIEGRREVIRLLLGKIRTYQPTHLLLGRRSFFLEKL